MKIKNWQINFLLLITSTILAFLIAEIALRVVKPHKLYTTLLPNVDIDQYNIHNKHYPGIDSVFHFEVNESGYRSESLFGADRYGILTIGGSTTNCIGLSNSDSWPWLIENKLNESYSSQKFTIGNIGALGHNSGNHLLELKFMEPQFENIKMVLILVGINDFSRFYLNEKYYIPTRQDKKLFERTFLQIPRKSGRTWYKRTELWMYLKDLRNSFKKESLRVVNDNLDDLVKKYKNSKKRLDLMSQKYLATEKTNKQIDLNAALMDFEDNILDIVHLAKSRNIKLVLITQPTLWHEGMTEYEEKIAVYAGRKVGDAYLSMSAMEEGLELFNDKLREISNKSNVDLIDLSKALPQDTSVFFDYCHFNKSGSIKVADIIYEELEEILKEEQLSNSEN